jgi:hypothetical protein
MTPEKAELHAAIEASLRQSDSKPERAEPESTTPLPPLIRPGTPDVAALRADGSRIPPETIRRVIRQSAGRFRECYQQSLVRHEKLTGRMAVRFDIEADGRVWRAEEEASTLSDRTLRECILMRLFELEFPNPGRQRLTVRYPWSFGQSSRPDQLPDATRIAEQPPPGFEEAMREGKPVRTDAPPSARPPAPARPASPCDSDPMCAEL